MIHYELCCHDGHTFDGWFNNSAGFEKQAKSGLLGCPTCGSTDVTRALMTPALSKGARQPAQIPAPQTSELASPGQPSSSETLTAQTPVAVDEARMPAQVRAALQRLRSQVESHCDYVGASFADEARRMHRGESDRRGIYGETTPEQAETLAEEGIQVARIPWVPRADG
jgi:hypothetical protein